MAVRNVSFDAIVSLVAGATKEQPSNIVHTWDGWTSKGVLHIVSRSGARTKNIWHFDIAKCQGATLYFRNTSGTAYVYTRPAPRDTFEAALRALNPHVRIELVSAIDVEMLTRGTGCSHDTRNGLWFSVLTDGATTVTRPAGVVGLHFNQHHVGCPTGPDAVQVAGGTYAVQVEDRHLEVRRVLVTPAADRDTVLAVIRTHQTVRYGCDSEVINEALRLIASGARVPGELVERTLRYAGEVCSNRVVDTDLLEKARQYHPEEVARRAEVARVIGWITEHLTAYAAEVDHYENGHASVQPIVILLPKSLGTPNWESLFDWVKEENDGRLSQGVRPITDPIPIDSLPDWAAEKLGDDCDRAQGDIFHVIKNMETAGKLAVTIFKEPGDFFGRRRGQSVLIHNGKDPNAGFGRVIWNRWWERR